MISFIKAYPECRPKLNPCFIMCRLLRHKGKCIVLRSQLYGFHEILIGNSLKGATQGERNVTSPRHHGCKREFCVKINKMILWSQTTRAYWKRSFHRWECCSIFHVVSKPFFLNKARSNKFGNSLAGFLVGNRQHGRIVDSNLFDIEVEEFFLSKI